MGLFDNIKKKNEAKKLGLSIEQYDEYLEAEAKGISLEDYKRYVSSFKGKFSLEQLPDYLLLEKAGMSDSQIMRFITELSSKIEVVDYADFLDAEKIGLTLSEYITYSNTLKTKMTAVEYVGFLKAQKIGFTMGKYLQYLKSFKEEMTLEEYDMYLRAEANGMDREHYAEYLSEYKDTYTVERYLEFDKARSLGMTLEEYDLRLEASKSGMSVEQFTKRKEAEKLGMSDTEYDIYLDLLNSNAIESGVLVIPEAINELPQNVFKHFEFTEFRLHQGITSIAKSAFKDCRNLKVASIPSFVKEIDEEAFSGCISLSALSISHGVERIGDSAFENCSQLTSVYVPGTVKKVDYHAFAGCSLLEKLEFGFGVEDIDVSEWCDLPNLKTVLTPASASISHLPPFRKKDPKYGIVNAESSLHMSDETKIDYIAPMNYSDYGLESNQNEIEYLEINGDYVFIDLVGFTNLKTVVFSAKGSVRTVKNCPSLQMILYRNFMSEIPTGTVLNEKEREEKIVEAKSLEMSRIDAPALRFLGVDDGALVIDLDNIDNFKLSWVHIPACCSRISLNSPAISGLAIHGNCKVSSDYLNNTDNLTVIRFDQDAREEGLFSNATAKNVLPSELSSCGLISLEYQQTSITAEHFGVQRAISAVHLPKGLCTICDNAFEGWGITSITIPSTVEFIGNNVFMDCKNLKCVTFDGIPETIGCDVFDGCVALESIKIDDETLSVDEFKNKYEPEPTVSFPVTNDDNEFVHDEFYSDEEADVYSIEDTSGESSNVVAVSLADQITVLLPETFTFSTDEDVIGANRALVAVLNDERADFANPYSSTESITVLFGQDMNGISNADEIANAIGIDNGIIVIDTDQLNVRYQLNEQASDLTIYLALICTEEKSFPVQVFFNHNKTEECDELIQAVFGAVSRCEKTKLASKADEQSHFSAPGSHTSDKKVITSPEYEAVGNERITSKDVPSGVLYTPGNEPDRIHQRLERLFEKLDGAYPDKVIVGLHKDHKKWGETVTELYRLLGYPDGNSFLNAYGYTVSSSVGGRPSTDPMEIIKELKRRYPNGSGLDRIADLRDANPDIASKFSNLQNQADKFFGMSFAKYLIQEGILVGKTDAQCEDEFEALKSRYAQMPFKGNLIQLKEANGDIDWNAINRFYSQTGTTDTFKFFLVKHGILNELESPVEIKLAELTEELKKRYPEGKKFSGSFEKLKFDNRDLSMSSLNSWTMQLHQEAAKDYLVRVGIMEAAKTAEDKLAEVTAILKERYVSGEKKAYSLTDLREQNLDLPISTIGTWSKKVFNQSASEYLTAQGILSEYDWMASMRIENERREAQKKALEERLEAEMNSPVETVYYDAPTYYVEEIDVCGEEAKDWAYKDDYHYHQGEIYIEDYLGDKDHIIIPTYINGKRITNLDTFGLKECKASTIEIPGSIKHLAGHLGYQNKNIKTVIIGEGVETVGESCFSFVENLRTVKVSKSVVGVVGDTAFKYTPWYDAQEDLVIIGSVLTEMKQDHAVLNVPDGIKTIGRLVAVFKSNLRKVIIPASVTTLSESAFSGRGNENIKEFIFTDSLKNIGLHSFGFNKWTESFGEAPIIINGQLYQFKQEGSTAIIPDGVTKICDEVFKDNKNIKKVVFPKSLKSIGVEAFAGCQSITSIDLPEGVERLEKASFYNCRKLASVTIPDSLIVIGRSAFNSCQALSEIAVGEATEEIGEKAFVDCTALKSVSMKSSVRIIGPEAFSKCSLLSAIDLPDSIVEIGSEAFRNCVSLKDISIPDSVEKVSSSAFAGCKSLKKASLGSSIHEIEASAFAGCAALEEIVLPAVIGQQAFSGCSNLRDVVFSDKMTKIESNAFAGCTSLTEVILPDIITEVGSGAFSGCSGMKNVVLPTGLLSIGKSAFMGCTALESVTIPETVKSIGDDAFKDCTTLKEVTMPETIEDFGIDVFTNSPYMKKAFGDYVVIGGVLTKYLGEEKQVTIPENVTTIGENAFAEARHVEVIIIPDGVKTIATKLMGEVYSWGNDPKPQLKKLIIGNGVTTIGAEAFANCEKLKEVIFGSGLITIGEKAFSGCNELQSIDLSNTAVTDIQQEAFSGCYRVKELSLSPNIETIDRSAFASISLGVIRLPKTVKKVERSAFDGTSELIVYDTIDPDAVEASEWTSDKWNGSVNSPLSCAMLGVPQSYVECQGNTRWRGYHITVLDAETDDIKYRIFCDSEERDEYRAMMFSAWGKYASFTFERYDGYFMRTRSILGRTEMAFCRIQYPVGLAAEHRLNYEAYLERCMFIERSAKRTAEMIANEDAVERLEILDRYKAIDDHNLAWISGIMKEKKAKRCMEYLNDHFSMKGGI